MKNDYLKDIIEDEKEREAIYKKGEEREEKSEKHYEEAILSGKINRRKSNIIALRYIAIGLTATVVGSSIIGVAINKTKEGRETQDELTAMVSAEDGNIILTRNYEVIFGDTLSSLSNRTGISVKDIQIDNGISNANRINVGQRLELNYSIAPEDLKYYTETESVNGRYISEIAGEYDTTIKTLCDINKEAIINNGDGTYTIISDTILVPKFITPNDLRDAQAKER